MIDLVRLQAAHAKIRGALLQEQHPDGHWVGELATSALSTATAVSALAIVARKIAASPTSRVEGFPSAGQLSELIERGRQWLAMHQNADGGWGDTDKSYSNIATTMLAAAAFRLAYQLQADASDVADRDVADRDVARRYETSEARAEEYIHRLGRVDALRRRYGVDKTFAVPILTNCALAGMADWSEVASLPFELACLPQAFYRFVRLPVVSYAIPALVAVGQVRFYHRRGWNPLWNWVRTACVSPSLRVLERMQPTSGGYLEAIPLTSFVVMSLAATDQHEHTVVRQGVKFLLDTVRSDGSWPIDTNLATWNTSLALYAIRGHAPLTTTTTPTSPHADNVRQMETTRDAATDVKCWDWLLSCQHTTRHPFTGAEPGGWGWSNLSGAVPDADDTPAALLALADFWQAPSCNHDSLRNVENASNVVRDTADAARRKNTWQAGLMGVQWLLQLQNRDGGWPTFCRGWGTLPFDRSGTDLTAHAMRALRRWQPFLAAQDDDPQAKPGSVDRRLASRIERAVSLGWRYLQRTQQDDGSWHPLWFGNQDCADETNPVYGTAKVLLAYRDLNRWKDPAVSRGLSWLVSSQNSDGSWGSGQYRPHVGSLIRDGVVASNGQVSSADRCTGSVEETSLAIEALLADNSPERAEATLRGIEWLVQAIEQDFHLQPQPIGFYFAKLWYYERLYPVVFATAAIRAVVERFVAAAGASLSEQALRLQHHPPLVAERAEIPLTSTSKAPGPVRV